MPIFSATFGSLTSISFLSASQSQSDLSPLVNFPHKLTLKTPFQWHHHYHSAKVFVSGNTQIDPNPDTGLLQRPTPPEPPQDDARLAKVCLSYSYYSFFLSSFMQCSFCFCDMWELNMGLQHSRTQFNHLSYTPLYSFLVIQTIHN